MPYRCLADFLEELGQAGELVRVEAEVEAALEAAEITTRVAEAGGPALLFGSVRGFSTPLLTALLATEPRVCRSLGVGSLDEVARRISWLAEPAEPEGWFERLKTAPQLSALGGLLPRKVKSAASQQVVRLGSDVDLGELPVPQSFPQEGGPTITAAVLLAADPGSGRQLAGRHDLQALGPDRLAACWASHDESARLLAEHRALRQKMPVAAVLGGDPALLLAAAAPAAGQVDVCALAGLLRQKPWEVVAGRSVELDVPADAEIIIEGYVDPAEPPVQSAASVAPAGHCCPARSVPVVHVTAVTHRANPVFPAMIAGPPYEACVLQRAMARVFLPLLKMAIPELVDYDLPMFAAARHWATLSIRKVYAGQARRVVHAAWGLNHLMFVKVLVVVDQDVDVHEVDQVLRAIAVHVDPGRDVLIQPGPPDVLDAGARPDAPGCRMAIDATGKLAGEHGGPWPQPAARSEEIRRLVSQRWEQYGLGPEPGGR